VVTFTLAVSVLTGLLFGLAPALRVSGTDCLQAMKGSAFSARAMLRGLGARAGFVIAEGAMAMLLLTGAGLLIHSFIKLSTVDPGFDSRHVLTFQVASPPTAQRDAFNQELVARLESMPDVEAAGFGELLPLESASLILRPLRIPGLPQEDSFAPGHPRTLEGSWDYFRTVGIRPSAGRLFRESDASGGPQVMLVNRALARRYFGGTNPVGKIVYSLGKAPWEIVGVVDDVHQRGPQSEPQPQFFLEYQQMLRALGAEYRTARINANQLYLQCGPAATLRKRSPTFADSLLSLIGMRR
jgi:putative ABC transport system permease protein